MAKRVKIRQHDITDCGAACLSSVASYYGLNIPLSRIRQYASTDTKGTNVLGMIEAGEKMGFLAKGVRGELDSLFKIPKPAIAHVLVNEVLKHFVVIYKVSQHHILIMDPADGKFHKMTHEEFKKIWTGVLLLLLPGDRFETGNKKVSISRRLWYLLQPHRPILTQALVGAAIYTILGLSTSVYVQKIVDYVLVGRNTNLLNLMSVVMLIVLGVQIFISVIKSTFVLKTGQLIDARLVLGYYKHLMSLPQKFFDTMRVGEIISRVNDAVKIRLFINNTLIEALVNGFTVLFAFALMFIYWWKLALIMLLIIPVYVLIYWITNSLNKKRQRKIMESSAELESQLVESLNGIYTIKSFGFEHLMNIKTETKFVSVLKSVYRSGLNDIFSANSSDFTSRLFTIILLWSGSYYVLQNELTPGELLSFYALIGYLTNPIMGLISMNKTLQDALIASDRLFELMDLEKEKDQKHIAIEQEQLGDIKFIDVHFRYGSRTKVFNNLNVCIKNGKISAIVGESGSGKTTLMTLLQKLYVPEKGIVKIGDLDLDYIDSESLRQIIGVVPQKIDLFSGSVLENIAVGEFNPDMPKVIRLCSELNILDFIEELPSGFNSFLGENGSLLSGGQRQKIAIARALYRDPEILILDEATASLDSSAEKHVHKLIQGLSKEGKTVIIIAHRLSTVLQADEIFVLDKGKLVESGNHRNLMEKEGKYYTLWKNQFPWFEKSF